MARIPLSAFAPIGTPEGVTNLVKYLSVLKPRERYYSKDCLASITSDKLKLQFCKEVLESGLYPTPDYYITTILEQYKVQRTAKIEQNRRKEQRLKQQREERAAVEKKEHERKTQRLEEERRLNQIRDNRLAAIEKTKKERQALLRKAYVSATRINSEDIIIARNVKASSFTVVQGCIYYLSYKLESVRIQAIPCNVLATIDRTFTIKKDSSSNIKANEVRRFIFEPATDLSEFLLEATKASAKFGKTDIRRNKQVEEQGTFYLPWKFVVFRDGYMFLIHPEAKGLETINPFRYENHLIHKSYGDFIPYIEKHATKLLVEGRSGRITGLLNFPEFAKIFPHLTSYASLKDGDISIDQERPIINRAYTAEEIRNSRFINKSQFLTYLCKMQLPSYKIYYLLENVVHESSDMPHDEFGFLFTVRESRGTLTLLYENNTDESRSSLVFNILRSEFESAVKFIAKFLASDEDNKRQSLAREQVRFYRYVNSYDRISHTAYQEWRGRINRLITYGSV